MKFSPLLLAIPLAIETVISIPPLLWQQNEELEGGEYVH